MEKTDLVLAKIAGRTALMDYFEASEKALNEGNALGYLDAADNLLDAIANYVEARRQFRAGMKMPDKSHYGAPGMPDGAPERAREAAEKLPTVGQLWLAAPRMAMSGPEYVPATMGQYRGWIHECGNVDWLSAEDAPADGGCDRCESGSSNAGDWRELFVRAR